MSYFLYFIGLLIGISFFVYIVSFLNTSKKKVKNLVNTKQKSVESTLEPNNINLKNTILKRAPGERICPLCGSTLTKYEALYASKIENESGSKILIHGCRYCYKPDENSDTVKKTTI